MRRYAQPRSLQDGKAMGHRLKAELERRGVRVNIGQALEILATTCGVRNWNTLREGLIRMDGAQLPAVDRTIEMALGLDRSDVTETVRLVEGFVAARTDLSSMTGSQARVVLRAAVAMAHRHCRVEEVPFTPDTLVASLYFGEVPRARTPGAVPHAPGFLDLFRWAHRRKESGVEMRQMAGALDILPGFSEQTALKGRCQKVMTSERFGLLGLCSIQPLTLFIDEARDRE